MDKVPLKMLKYYNGINPGEIAGYSKDTAKIMVKKGYGKYYIEGEVEEEVEDSAPEPEAKVMVEPLELVKCTIEKIKEELEVKVSGGAYLYDSKYISDVLDVESLGKGREGLMEYLMELTETRDAPAE